MTQVIKELALSCVDTGFIKVSTPPLAYPEISKIPSRSFNTCLEQGFVWHSNYAAFGTLGTNGCEVRVVVSEELIIEPDSIRAILVPYCVPNQAGLYISDDDPVTLLNIAGGQYKLMYQTRLLTDDEILASTHYTEEQFDPSVDSDAYRPELCSLTFIPSDTETAPEILRKDVDLNPPSRLLLIE